MTDDRDRVADRTRKGLRRRLTLALAEDPDADEQACDDDVDPVHDDGSDGGGGEELFDLDESAEPAVDGDRHARTRRSALRWAAAAAAVVVLAGVAAAVAWKSPKSGTAAGARTLRLNGHTYVQRSVAADAAFRDPTDPAAFDVLVLATDHNSDVRCDRLRPAVRLVAQSATTVTVAATVYQVPTTDTYYCGLAGPIYRRTVVHLSAALGDRAVVNASDGSAVGVVDAAGLPVPTYVPAGYAPGAVDRPDVAGGSLQARRTYHRGETSLVLDEGPSSPVGSAKGAPDAIVSVSAHRAEVRTANARRCIAWTPRPGMTRDVCSAGPSILSQNDLLRVARSLR